MTKVRSFLKWAGSKYNCVNQIISSLPAGSRLIEPFAGSGSVFMNSSYDSYLLAERNPDLINIFHNLQNHGDEFINYCNSFFQPEFNHQEKYYELRTQFNQLTYSTEKAAIFLYLNRHGYNGLCRYNSKGIYNVPFGRYIKPYFPRAEMHLFHQKSKQAHFINNDFRDTFALAKPGDIIYCDPPYVALTESSKHLRYTQDLFTDSDQIELAEFARRTAKTGIPVLISNHDTEFTRTHYQEAKIMSFSVTRWINCQSDNRRPVKELLAIFQ